MHDLPSLMLLQQSHAPVKTGEELETLGKVASHKFLTGAIGTLNDAVVQTVKSAGLAPEQVRRVIEFANTDAFLKEYKKEGSANRYVEFEGGPADPATVLQDLNDGGGGTVFDRGSSDYCMPPIAKVASADGDALGQSNFEHLSKTASAGVGPAMSDIVGDMARDMKKRTNLPAYAGFDLHGEQKKKQQVRHLSAMTGRSPVVVKHAEAEGLLDFNPEESALKEAFASSDEQYDYADPLQESIDLRDKLAGAASHMSSELEMHSQDLQDTSEGLYYEVKEAARSGVSLGQMLKAWEGVVPDASYMKIAFSSFSPRLVEDEVFPSADAIGASLQKTASVGMVNPEHPLVVSMSDFCDRLHKVAHLRESRDELQEAAQGMNEFIYKTAGVVSSVSGAVGRTAKRIADSGGVIPRITGAARKAGDAAGKFTQGAGELAMGAGSKGARTAGDVVRKGVTYAPHAAAGVGGALALQEAHDRSKYSPTLRTAKNFALSRVPYTTQNQLRLYQMSMNGPV